jgi:hypothetical protein
VDGARQDFEIAIGHLDFQKLSRKLFSDWFCWGDFVGIRTPMVLKI